MDEINFTVNGNAYSTRSASVNADTSLNDYLRFHLNLFGTKAMCHEGGCGACIVSVCQIHPMTKETHVFAVNSCLVNILSCNNWDITTVEGIGNRRNGYHPIQRRLADYNGSQCGYCTPGWVMNMYSLYENADQQLTKEEIENSFGGNMCRCTGYRPILDAFKSFASDADLSSSQKIEDLEDLDKMKCVRKSFKTCSLNDDEWCVIETKKQSLLTMELTDGSWYTATDIKDVFQVLARENSNDYRLVAGNTGQGVYPRNTIPKVQIDISAIQDLREVSLDVNLVIGAGVPLTEVMDEFLYYTKNHEEFRYLDALYRHLDLVAHIPVRNVGTIGGNLALKNQHHEFQSDVFLLLTTVGATVTLMDRSMSISQLMMEDFLKTDLKHKLILNVKLPPFSSSHKIRTYKVMRRAQNAHAIVNGGFLFKLDSANKVTKCNITYGAINPKFVKATNTEKLLTGLHLFKNQTLQEALESLKKELFPDNEPPEPSPWCRKTIALALFYKAVLSLCPTVAPRYKSGGSMLERGVSQGTQSFDTDKTLWPVNEPVHKLEGLQQCSGEVHYVCDVVSSPHEVYVAFVLSTICVGEIIDFDPSEALNTPGVVAFFTAKDIPGKNSFIKTDLQYVSEDEEILATKKISYYGQPVGLIAAKTQKLAIRAAKLVRVTYKKSSAKPVLSIEDALVAPDKSSRIRQDFSAAATEKGSDTKYVIKGEYYVPSQYHYTMETQSCTVSVTEFGLTVRSSTQWIDHVQIAISQSLAIPENRIDVVVPRVGGAFGSKASRANLTACACALVSHLLNRTATLVMPLTDNMAAIGKRQDFLANYEFGVNNQGLVQYANVTYYTDCGISHNDLATQGAGQTISNLYDVSRWNITGFSVLTDKHANTWCRGPGSTEGAFFIEHIMERIVYATKNDPVEVRSINLATKHIVVRELLETVRTDSQFDERQTRVNKFNSKNAWKKRGIKLGAMSYPMTWIGTNPVLITVFRADATIMIAHGGVEVGQGINTKIAQVCAFRLKVPIEKITVRASESFTGPNSIVTGTSITSESLALATINACNELLLRLEPAKKELNNPTWEEIIQKAFEKGVNLQVNSMFFGADKTSRYSAYGVCVTEVELDVLTGTHTILRVDLIEDTGVSLSPEIDIGQIEGAFVTGVGLVTTEELVFDPLTGRLLTDRTWTYKPPGAKDIPIDFRISFMRNAENPVGVLGSKATGEPALTLGVVVTFALHAAILEARKEYGHKDTSFVPLKSPATTENILRAISPKTQCYKLN